MTSQGDVTVFGLMVPTCVIPDITMDVPHGHTMVIPAEKAHVSKDLWRLIGQKCLFQMRSGPRPAMPSPYATSISSRQQKLEDENAQLRSDIAQQQRASADTQAKLDTILGLLQSGALSVASASHVVAGTAQKTEVSTVDGSAPTFIPTTITPEGAQARIESKKEESTSTATSSASKLREMRKKGQQ
jgi:hypothetical protein